MTKVIDLRNPENDNWMRSSRKKMKKIKAADTHPELREGLPVERQPVQGGRVVQKGTQFCVEKDDAGLDKNFGCYPSREEAEEKL